MKDSNEMIHYVIDILGYDVELSKHSQANSFVSQLCARLGRSPPTLSAVNI